MFEWHASTIDGAHTGHIGSRLCDWLNPKLAASVPQLFAGADIADSERALLTAVTLFDEASHDIAKRLSFPLTVSADDIRLHIARVMSHAH